MALPIITIIGNIKKIETRFTSTNKQVTKFQIECSEKDKDGNWTNLYIGTEVWENSAKFVNDYFHEGSLAIVTGELYTNVYEKQDGTKVYETRLKNSRVQFAPKDKATQQPQQNQAQQQNHNVYQPQQNQQQYVPPQQPQVVHENVPQDYHPNQGTLSMSDEYEIPFGYIGLENKNLIYCV